MKKAIFFFFCCMLTFSSFTFYAQQAKLDSLWNVWQDKTKADTSRVEAFYLYIWDGFLFSQPDSALGLAEELISFSEDIDYQLGKGLGYGLMGLNYYLQGNYILAHDFFNRSLKIFEEQGDKEKLANTLGYLGAMYTEKSDYLKALDYFNRTSKIYEELEDRSGIAKTMGNIANIYYFQGNNTYSLEYTQRSLEIFEEIGDKNAIASARANIGAILLDMNNFSKALDHFTRSKELYEELGNKVGVSLMQINIGDVYWSQDSFSKALEYFHRSLINHKELGRKKEIAYLYGKIGMAYSEKGDYEKALDYCHKGKKLADTLYIFQEQKLTCQCLYEAYKTNKKWKEALTYYEKFQEIEDSLKLDATDKQLQQFEFDRKILQDSLATERERRKIAVAHQEEIRRKEYQQYAAVGSGVLILLLAGGLYGKLYHTRRSKLAIEAEKNRSEKLLLNILPAEIAEELKNKGRAEARDFEMVSILFTDFKEFTQTSEKLSAKELVEEINTCFEAFDKICDKHQIEKIKTIGDSYMAAGGLPVPTAGSVKNTVMAALEMQAFITQRKIQKESEGEQAFQMRVGIHTGPVVAGIVGVKKFQYDIWGDAVNTASRMESHGEVGKVNISQNTYDSINDDPEFNYEPRGQVQAKGKGMVEMYFVNTVRSNQSKLNCPV